MRLREDQGEVIMPGLTTWRNRTGFTAVELRMEAAPTIFTPEVIASEKAKLPGWMFRKEYLLDWDAQTGTPVFDPEWLDWQHKHESNPLYRMDLADEVVSPGDEISRMDLDESGRLVERERGRLAVWIQPTLRPKEAPSTMKEVLLGFGGGIDVSEGVLKSNSTIEIFRADNREQAAEFACNSITPSDLGRFAVAVGRYYNNALLCPVRRMHGLTTMRTILDECGYAYVWHDKIADRIIPSDVAAMGWRGGELTEFLFGPWIDAIHHHETILHSVTCLLEHQQYIYDERGRIVFQALAQLPVEVRERHADRVVACALAYRACLDMPAYVKLVEKKAPYMSFKWRRQQALREQPTGRVKW